MKRTGKSGNASWLMFGRCKVENDIRLPGWHLTMGHVRFLLRPFFTLIHPFGAAWSHLPTALLNNLLINKCRCFRAAIQVAVRNFQSANQLGLLSADSPDYERSEANCEVFFTVVGKYLTAAELPFSNYQLNAQFFYYSTICMLHYAPQRVSSSTLLILRRTNCITTASGIVTLCKQPYSMQVEGGLSPLSTCILYGCLQRVTIPEAVVIQFVLLRMSSVLLETCWGA